MTYLPAPSKDDTREVRRAVQVLAMMIAAVLLAALLLVWVKPARATPMLAGWVAPARAAPVLILEGLADNGIKFRLRLLQRACASTQIRAVFLSRGIAAEKASEWMGKMKAGELLWADKPYQACWFDGGGQVFFLDSAGDWFNGREGIPRKAFREEGV